MKTISSEKIYQNAYEGEYNQEITLHPLREMEDYEIADGYQDVRDWKVYASNEFIVGKVRDLICSKELERVLYLDVEVENSAFNTEDKNLYLLVPIGLAFFNEDKQYITIHGVDTEQFITYPRYDGENSTPDYEMIVHNYVVAKDDQLSPYEKRHAGIYTHDVYSTPNLTK